MSDSKRNPQKRKYEKEKDADESKSPKKVKKAEPRQTVKVQKKVKTESKGKNVKTENKEEGTVTRAKTEKSESLKIEKKEVKTENAKKSSQKAQNTKNESCTPLWSEPELLAEQYGVNVDTATNIIKLLEDGNTIPFIARYRKDATNNMTPEDLRAVKDTYEEIINLKNKMGTVIKNLEKSNALTEDLKRAVTASTSIEELEYVYAPYKPGSKRTLAEKAKELGLEELALNLLHCKKEINVQEFVGSNEELPDVAAVEKGMVHIIASVMATDTEILSALKEIKKNTYFVMKTKKMTSKKDSPENKESDFKFDNYMNFEMSVKYIKPHQVLAINRGENLKILSVKLVVPDSFFQEYKRLCFNKFLYKGKDPMREKIIKESVDDSYHRLVEPLIKREIRSELKQKAERASCEVFSTNLKQLLLATPLKGKPILGIDPGYSNGCKLAVISPMGNLLDSGIIYPHKKSSSERDATILKNLLQGHNCELIALGNGTACRQTEEWLTNLIQIKFFHPLEVQYTIVREDGASIYSCSPEAKKEFPTLDPNIISAVSLARRVQEPLAELIKVEPKHLGIGMYQHDVKKKQLDEALNDVISECVSFVGVDLNTASQCLLKHVAGLSEKRAQQIINHRNKNGAFICRKQLMEVFGIGQKVFLQCAGFLRVGPLNNEMDSFYQNTKASKLDCTNIHPESYDLTATIIKRLNLKLSDVGEPHFIASVKEKMCGLKLNDLSQELKSDEPTVQLIFDALSRPLNHDFRNDSPKGAVFKKAVTSIDDICSGSILTGVVSNVTHFGCFVDIGVGSNGLVHVSKYNGLNPQIGNKIEVRVLSVEADRKRIGLQALKVLA